MSISSVGVLTNPSSSVSYRGLRFDIPVVGANNPCVIIPQTGGVQVAVPGAGVLWDQQRFEVAHAPVVVGSVCLPTPKLRVLDMPVKLPGQREIILPGVSANAAGFVQKVIDSVWASHRGVV